MEDNVIVKEVVKVKEVKPKLVKVKVTTPFRFARKDCNSKTKKLPIGVANWMVKKRFGKIL